MEVEQYFSTVRRPDEVGGVLINVSKKEGHGASPADIFSVNFVYMEAQFFAHVGEVWSEHLHGV